VNAASGRPRKLNETTYPTWVCTCTHEFQAAAKIPCPKKEPNDLDDMHIVSLKD
jgi:hypothetical protein